MTTEEASDIGIIVEARPGGGSMQWEPGHPAGKTVGKEGDNSSSAKAREHQAEAGRLSSHEGAPIA